ncbi:hypothetical protein Tco_0747969 [Tanacetum coccineum]|uniref:Uncharacterized protein n=1 Tax=Tanacetum coccineum TaxID=301880 RepID=A0ABQ4YXP4_9ASTR
MLRYKPFIPILGGIHLLEFLQNSTLTIILHNELVRGNELKLGDTLIKTSASGKDNKDKSEQNQSKPTRNGKGKTRVKNESQNQSRISPIQQEKKANESQRTNVDKKQKSRRPKEKDTEIPQSSVPSDPINVEDEAINEEPSMQQRVLDLENTKTAQAQEITSLKKRVKKSARVVSFEEASLGNQEDASKQGRKIHDINVDEDITLENVHDAKMFGVNDLEGDEVVVESEVADKDVNLSVDEVTLVSNVIPTTAATTITGVSSRPKAKGIVFHEQEQEQEKDPTPTVSSQQPTQVKDKAEEDEEESLAREKAQKVKEANIAWDDIQAKVEADYQLAQRLQAQEQEELSDAEKATLFVQLLEKRRKHYATKRAEEKRNRPPTKAQVNTFVDMDTELVKESSKKAKAEIAQESSSKRAGEDLEQESSKKKKVDDDKETKELKQCMKSFQMMEMIEDLEVLWSIVKERFKKIEPVNYMDTFLHLNLKTMFEHHLEDNVWKNQQGLVKVLNWKLYDSIYLYLLVPTGRYVVPTGRVIATDSVIVATSGYVVPAAYDIRPGRVK